jgi:hypothetical protein
MKLIPNVFASVSLPRLDGLNGRFVIWLWVWMGGLLAFSFDIED